jgi:hypothetical protein
MNAIVGHYQPRFPAAAANVQTVAAAAQSNSKRRVAVSQHQEREARGRGHKMESQLQQGHEEIQKEQSRGSKSPTRMVLHQSLALARTRDLCHLQASFYKHHLREI